MAKRLMSKTPLSHDTRTLAADKRFGRYAKEGEMAIREVKPGKNEMLDRMMKAWSGFGKVFVPGTGERHLYENALKAAQGLECSATDINSFCISLGAYKDTKGFAKKAGLFISALINLSSGTTFEINTEYIEGKLDLLGCRNTKRIVVIGDVCEYLGNGMEGGSILLRGDARGHVGNNMRGGELVVEGACGGIGSGMQGGKISAKSVAPKHSLSDVGFMMKGGEIELFCDAPEDVGFRMMGGKITVHGHVYGVVGKGMEGGSIIIHGNAYASVSRNPDAKGSVGCGMKGGNIFVEGDVTRKAIAIGMEGGEIHIWGKIGRISPDHRGGRIIHKGRIVGDDPFAWTPNEERPPKRLDERPVMEQLQEIWNAYHKAKKNAHLELLAIKSVDYCAGDVGEFSAYLSSSPKKQGFRARAGRFLSSLAINCDEEEITLRTGDTKIGCLAYKNCKNVRVIGNAGPEAGLLMIRGSLAIQGDAGPSLGKGMKGGDILVGGNAEDIKAGTGGSILVFGDSESVRTEGARVVVCGNATYVGTKLSAGEIIVRGDAELVGMWGMTGGTIIVEGMVRGVKVGWQMEGGKITVGGIEHDPSGQGQHQAQGGVGYGMKGGEIIIIGKGKPASGE